MVEGIGFERERWGGVLRRDAEVQVQLLRGLNFELSV